MAGKAKAQPVVEEKPVDQVHTEAEIAGAKEATESQSPPNGMTTQGTLRVSNLVDDEGNPVEFVTVAEHERVTRYLVDQISEIRLLAEDAAKIASQPEGAIHFFEVSPGTLDPGEQKDPLEDEAEWFQPEYLRGG